MHYNPLLFRWEGNENALAPFDVPVPSSPHSSARHSPKPAPALITHYGAANGVQISGGMVFDPQRMCWLKMAPAQSSNSATLRGGMGSVQLDEEEDVFAGLDDLKEENAAIDTPSSTLRPIRSKAALREVSRESMGATSGDEGTKGAESGDEGWNVSEEFDVGPEFVRRQRTEEERWRRKVEKWIGEGRKHNDEWRWAIRDFAQQ